MSVVQRAALRLIRVYQAAISPLVGVACRFEPSCSRYAYQAIEVHGIVRGMWLGVRRLSRCRPGGGSGYDPVPPRRAGAREPSGSRSRAGRGDAPEGSGRRRSS